MKSRNFKQANVKFAENQDEYQTLPAYAVPNDKYGQIVTSFKLSEKEIKQVIETGTIYLRFLTFNKPLQPIGQDLLNPF